MNQRTLLLSLALASTGLCSTAFAADTETLPSGVQIVHTVVGTGGSPNAVDRVKVHYRGTLADGKEFDSSYKRNEPAVFPLNRVVPCVNPSLEKNKGGRKAHQPIPPSHPER